MRIIGVAGKKYSGKDTVGNYLVKYHGYRKIAFADALKRICKLLFDFTDEQLNTDLKDSVEERWDKTPREILQFVGTELLRDMLGNFVPKLGKSIWIDIVRRQIMNSADKIVITDVRFENEMNLVHELGGIVFLVERDTNYSDSHVSEQNINILKELLNENDKIIHNNGTLDELYQQIESCVFL